MFGLATIALIGFLSILILVKWICRVKYHLPPSPRGLPLIGNVREFSTAMSCRLWATELRDKLGDVFMLRVGGERIIIVNDYDTAVEALVMKHNRDLSGRPKSILFKALTENYQDIIVANYSAQWKIQRKFGNSALRIFMQGEAMNNLLRNGFVTFENGLSTGEYCDPHNIIQKLFFNIICDTLFGKYFDTDSSEGLRMLETFREMSTAIRKLTIIEAIPPLWYLPIPILTRYRKHVDSFLKFVQKMIDLHRDKSHEACEDITDYFLAEIKSDINSSRKFDEVHIRQSLSDLIIAGTDTSTAVLYWLMKELARQPKIQENIFKEIQNFHDQNPSSHLTSNELRNHFHYTQAVVQEALRYGCVVPRGLPHLALRDCKIDEYDVPKGSIVLVNIYAFHFDEKYWKNPFEFQPERFLDNNGEIILKKSGFGSFGFGIRKCLGENIAKMDLLMLTCLLCARYHIEGDPSNVMEEMDENNDNNLTRLPSSYRVKFNLRDNRIPI